MSINIYKLNFKELRKIMKKKNVYLYTKMVKHEMIRYLIEMDPIKNYNRQEKKDKMNEINFKLNKYFTNNNYKYRSEYNEYSLRNDKSYTKIFIEILFIEKYFNDKIIYEKYFYHISRELKIEILRKNNIGVDIYSDIELKKYENIPLHMPKYDIVYYIKKALIYGNKETQEKLNTLKITFDICSNIIFKQLLNDGITKYYCAELLENILKNDKNFLINYANEYHVYDVYNYNNSNDIKTLYEKYKYIQKIKNKLHLYIKIKYNVDLYDDILHIIKKYI